MRRSRGPRTRASACAELRRRCESLVDVSHLLRTRCGQNVARKHRTVETLLLDKSIALSGGQQPVVSPLAAGGGYERLCRSQMPRAAGHAPAAGTFARWSECGFAVTARVLCGTLGAGRRVVQRRYVALRKGRRGDRDGVAAGASAR